MELILSDAREIVIRGDGTVASVDACHRGLVAPLLSYETVQFLRSGGAVHGVPAQETLGRLDGGTFRFPAKLAFRVASSLEARGLQARIEFQVRGYRPDPIALEESPEVFRKLFHARSAIAGGLLEGFPAPETTIPILLRLYPAGRIVVPVQNREEERRWARHLKASKLPQQVCSPQDLAMWWGNRPKVLVCSFDKLDKCQVQDFGMTIVPDVGPLCNNGRWDPDRIVARRWDFQLLRDPKVAAFGFLPARALSCGELLRLEAMFLQRLQNSRARSRSIHVEFIRFDPESVADAHKRPRSEIAEQKRVEIWTSVRRNTFIREHAAREVAAEPNNRVIVLVENPTHARELLRDLPSEWECRTGDDAKNRRGANRLIVTESWMAAGGLDADVVIDARGAAPIDQQFLMARGGKPIRLVDVADVGPRLFALTAQTRLKGYEVRGWMEPIDSPEVSYSEETI